MKYIVFVILSAGILGVAVAFSGSDSSPGELKLKTEARNPWTSTRLNNNKQDFQFAIVSDRTGGHRAKIFSQTVARLNLLQPEFVVSVGDLIEGYTPKMDVVKAEWKEFDGYVKQLQMPFFYVPGNHDITNKMMEDLWKAKYGRRYYSFVYRNVLFLMLNSEDPPGRGKISDKQLNFVKQALAANRKVRWTLVFLHKPLWYYGGDPAKNGWLAVEKELAGRPYTVFCGHIHRYKKFIRNGQNYYQLATTGGISRVRGVEYGEFDHIVWVTMKKKGPVLANIRVDSILPEDLKTPESKEEGYKRTLRPTHPVKGMVYFEGAPTPQAYIVFNPVRKKGNRGVRADGMVRADGSFQLSTYSAFDGVAAGEYVVTVSWRKPFYPVMGQKGPNLLPEKYENPKTSPLRASVEKGGNTFTFELKR